MPLSDLQRKYLKTALPGFSADLAQARTEATKEALAVFVVPANGVITGFQGSYTAESGTGPSLTLTLERGTTVLSTIVVTTAETPVRNKNLSIAVSEGETLNIKAAAANTDNAFEGVNTFAELQTYADA